MSFDEPSVFDHLDYRQFLRDWYAYHRQLGQISLRLFSKRAGFSSPNFFKLVMDGDRNLTIKSLPKFMSALGLNKQELEFFENMVFFTQAATHEERDRYYQGMLRSRKLKELKPIVKEQYQYYSEWYHPVVRELVVSKNFNGDLEKLGASLSPSLSTLQIEKSIELLSRLGLIVKDENGKWQQASVTVSSGQESDSHMLTKYHQNIFDLGKRIIEQVDPELRDVSALTLGISKKRFGEIKQRIQNFRTEILQLVASDTEPDDVVLLTIQLMPVTQGGAA